MAAYLELYHSGKLRERVETALSLLESCSVCSRSCGVNRLVGDTGKCHTPREAMVSSYGPHFGEEAPLVGQYGSDTIFFTNCDLRCLFCQNYAISQLGEGQEVSKEELVYIMLSIQAQRMPQYKPGLPNPCSCADSGSTGTSSGVRLASSPSVQQRWL